MPSSESESPKGARKRQRTSRSSPDDGKKARGRPRVDTQDATAADRRRTQIRLAQRAYRQRKETTIVSLKGQVEALQRTIDQMNKSFLNFNDRLVSSGQLVTVPDLARELKSTTEQFINLAKEASQAVEEDEGVEVSAHDLAGETAVSSSKNTPPSSPRKEDVPINDEVYAGWGYTKTLVPEGSPEPEQDYTLPDPVSAIAQATTIVHNNRTQLQPWSLDVNPTSLTTPKDAGAIDLLAPYNDASYPFDFDPNIQLYPVTGPSEQLPITGSAFQFGLPSQLTPDALAFLNPVDTASVRAPYTYSFMEKSFSRRLQRATIEACFQIINEEPDHPHLRGRALKFTLQFRTMDQIRNRFLEVLQRSVDDSLDPGATPFIHLGGAGTHYPQKDENGNIIPKPNGYNVLRTGPLTVLENAQNPNMRIQLDCDTDDFAGEWFDANDVEGYLLEKGIHIDAQSSFAEAEIISSPVQLDMTMGPNMTSMESNGSTTASSVGLTRAGSISTRTRPTTPTFYENLTGIPDVEFDSYLLGGPEISSIPPGEPPKTDYMSKLVYDPNFDYFSKAAGAFPMIPQTAERRIVTLDVTKFVTELVKRAVCLGRAPGYRRNDVDLAFNTSILPVY